MSTSITASTVSPFTGLELQDASYVATATWVSASAANVSSSTAALYLPNVDYPTTGKFIVQVFNNALTNTANSNTNYVKLQESNDSVIWNDIAVFTSSLLPCTDNGSNATPAGSVQVLLTPNAKPYLRASGVSVLLGSTSGGITGSYGVALLF